MDYLISFLTSTETPFFFLFVTLFVLSIRATQRREKVCNQTLEKIKRDQAEILTMLRKERTVKRR